jgi:hypothetical protein
MDAIGVRVQLYNDPTVRNPQTGEYGSVRIRRVPVAVTNPQPRADAPEYDESEACRTAAVSVPDERWP